MKPQLAALVVSACALVVPSSAGTITLIDVNFSVAANLTTLGISDWVHWGDTPGDPTATNRKATGGSQISNYASLLGAPVNVYSNDSRGLTWTDGSPASSSIANHNGVFTNFAVNQGFSFTAPADISARILYVFVGGFQDSGQLVASLSDGSAPNVINTQPVTGGQYDANYTLAYSANSPGQTLTITWSDVTHSTQFGNVTLSGAALQVPGSIPEPATFGLFGAGLGIGCFLLRLRRVA